MDPVFHGAVRDGQIFLERPAAFASLKATLEGAQIDLILCKHRNRRSNQANRWYWRCIVKLLAEHCGYEPEEMHDALKQRFLKSHEDSELPTVRSSAELTTAEFSDYCESCRRLAAEMGVVIPNPGEYESEEAWQK